ncbi:lysozyme inhibitor LprI family protein [Yersinia bercovieri]|uniref:lysozyme inhibitor LprI family protein n=1 Tax=Yersinia bercovieri TaxID=634 RepID=UPI0005DE91F5|nr:lysozyme inhibitor LprI family protein [Yersinia bercovieri]CFQ27547.1 Uncharacterized protein conserved in bacteria [Yersinia bercovieri]
MKANAIHYVVAGAVFTAICTQTSIAAATESAETLYKQCQAKQTTVEQRECYPLVAKESEVELVAAEKKVRTAMVELEKVSEGSRSMHPVKAFDNAERAYRAFRTAESHRVLASYGSGNGGGLASYQTIIEMNMMRIHQLNDQ